MKWLLKFSDVELQLEQISKEAQNAESKADFIHKFKISAKEADELQYWLELCLHSDFYPNPSEELLKKLQSIHLIISKIISSSKKK